MPLDDVPVASNILSNRIRQSTTDFVSVDFETRGTRRLPVVGLHKYFEDPWAEVMMMAYAFNQDEPHIWFPNQPFPRDLARHIERGGVLHAWNAMFERIAWRSCMYVHPQPLLTQWRCTMVRAGISGVPMKLEFAAKALKVKERKDMDNQKAMVKLSKPRGKFDPSGDAPPVWWNDEALLKKCGDYCMQDVRTERAVGNRLPYLSPSEERQYWYDQIVADRGILIDQELCRSAVVVVKNRQKELLEESIKICGASTSRVAAVKKWIESRGVTLPTLRKDDVVKVLRDRDLDPKVRRILQIRQESGKSSTSKYVRALQCVCSDGTLKGSRQFGGAHTGRWAGRLVQMDNLPRPPKSFDTDKAVGAIKTRSIPRIVDEFRSVMSTVSYATRGIIVAPEGRKLYVGDYKSIESRMLAATSGQKSTLDQWRLSDKGMAPDVYAANGAEMFNVPIDVAATQGEYRQWGKIAELLLGYQGGTGALLRNDSADWASIYPTLFKLADEHTRQKVHSLWKLMGKGDEKTWKAARFVVEAWRKKNPMSVKLWFNLQEASVEAVKTPGKKVKYRGIAYEFEPKKKVLLCHLMSGKRALVYPQAHLVTGRNAKGDPELQLRAYSLINKVWTRYHPYGGLLTENIVQAQARDVMAEAFVHLETAGYTVHHTVHDEVIASHSKGSVEEFIRLMGTVPSWVPDMPVGVEAWSGIRYQKH